MKQPIIFCSPLLATITLASLAGATDYYVSPSGSGSTCSDASPCTLSSAMSKVVGGDTIYMHKGNYSGFTVAKSGSSSAWITFAAYPGEVPYVSNGGVGVNGNYIRFDGIVSRNNQYGGFGNPYSSACAAHTAGYIQYIHCIADGNGLNGIAHYCAPGLLIQQSIIAHNGAGPASWSSGGNLYGVTGGTTSNIVRESVAFDNWDSSSNHSDGSGFILDEYSTGATFINNIGFENGGSCIRLTNSSNSLIVNNTCYGNAKDPAAQYNDEIMYSDAASRTGAILVNNISIPTTSGKNGIGNASGITQSNNVTSGSASMFVSVPGGTNVDFNLTSSATTAIDKGTTSNAPTTEIGFDPKCITKGTPTGVYVGSGNTMPTWWTYVIDYAYIEQIGGVAKCFNPRTRTSTPDIGAFEYNGTPSTGGAAGTGGTSATGGTTATGGRTATGGAATGGANTGGTSSSTGGWATGGALITPSGGSSTGGTSTFGGTTGIGGVAPAGGTTAVGGTAPLGGTGGSGGSPEGQGCNCRTAPAKDGGYARLLGLVGLSVLAMRRRRARR
jgi:MYXO-CTERM domain-containing protein